MARYSGSMSPDTISAMFPDRPIHPLPKRRLRERLSPEVADSIEYPPTPPTTVFYYPYNSKDENGDIVKGGNRSRGTANGDLSRALDSEEEDPSRSRRSLVPRSAPSILGRPVRTSQRIDQSRQGHNQAPPSTASSVDGYDTFENTNNKKKRKVPDTALGGHSLNDLGVGAGQISPSTPSRVVHGDTCGANCSSYHGMGSGSPGISGPGRGRFGRNRSGRSPLSEGSRNSKVRPVRWPLSVEKLPSQKGQENVSLLQLQQSSKSSPASGQFTFTCDSQVPGTVSWPGSYAKQSVMGNHHAAAAGQGTAKSAKGSWPGGGPPDQAGTGPGGGPRAGAAAPQAASQKKTRRRSRLDEYAKAAADRKRQTQIHNFHHPPKEEEMWICHFCEYEYIFGEKPEALIRQYEIKDRKKRKEEEERRRLLEKAKARGRKGKKGTKAPTKGGTAGQDRGHTHDHQEHGHEHAHGLDQDYDDHYQDPAPDDDGDTQDNKSSDDVDGEYEAEGGKGHIPQQVKPPDIPTSGVNGVGRFATTEIVGGGADSSNAGGHPGRV